MATSRLPIRHLELVLDRDAAPAETSGRNMSLVHYIYNITAQASAVGLQLRECNIGAYLDASVTRAYTWPPLLYIATVDGR